MPSLEDQLAAQQYGALKGQPFPPGVLTRITDLSSDQLAHLTSRPPVFVPAPGISHALAFLATYVVAKSNTIPFLASGSRIGFPSGDPVSNGGLTFSDPGTDATYSWANLDSSQLHPLALFENQPLVSIFPFSDDPSGAILANVLNAGGAGYAALDTFDVDGGGFPAAAGVVDTVAAGVVTAYHLTSRAFGYVPTVGATTTATSGAGAGLTIDIQTITPANGTARVWTLYTVLDLP